MFISLWILTSYGIWWDVKSEYFLNDQRGSSSLTETQILNLIPEKKETNREEVERKSFMWKHPKCIIFGVYLFLKMHQFMPWKILKSNLKWFLTDLPQTDESSLNQQWIL